MKKELLTGTHPRWPEFVMTLGRGLNLREENGKEKWDSDGDLSKSTKILESMGDIDIPATIDYLKKNGVPCDCKVLLNVNTISEEEKDFEIGYRLDYSGPDGSLHTALISTIRNLPREVREFALENCFFLSMEEGLNGTVVAGSHGSNIQWHMLKHLEDEEKIKRINNLERKWRTIVLLDYKIASDEDVDSIIAHEIAHAYLGHDHMTLGEVENREINGQIIPVLKLEYDAYKLTRSWGFNGSGADVEKSALSEDVISCLKKEEKA